MLDTAATHHGNANTGNHHRQSKTTKSEQPTKSGVNGTTKWPCHMKVHRQHKDNAETDAPDSPEFDFAATHYFARC
jgi:hypothetical protein